MARKKTLVEDASLTPEQLKTLVRVMKDPFLLFYFLLRDKPSVGYGKVFALPFSEGSAIPIHAQQVQYHPKVSSGWYY